MDNLGRHPVRDVLLLPATHDRQGDEVAHQAGMHEQAPYRQVPSEDVSPGPDPSAPGVRIAVRRAGITDLLSLSRFSSRYELNQPVSSRTDSDPARATLRGYLPFSRQDQPVFVATNEEERRLLGFVQFRAAGPDQRWIAESIGANAGVYDPEPVVLELVRHAIKAAGLSGVKRLYARLEPECPLQQPMRQIGFAPYGWERVMASSSVPVLPAARGVRIQEQADVWEIHQLYLQSTPRDVQYAEALTSHSWDVDAVLRSRGYGCRGWLIADQHLAVAYARAITRKDAHVVDLMVLPDHRDVLPALLFSVFRELATLSSRLVYVVIRHYQSELVAVLEDLGFVAHIEQEVHIRYTTASVRSSVMAAQYSTADSQKEPAVKRVPTFFHGTADRYHMQEGVLTPEDRQTEALGAFETGE
jgi:hypothetical protein